MPFGKCEIGCQQRDFSVISTLQQLFSILPVLASQRIINEDVRIKEYSCHRFNRAFSRGSFSISLSVNDAQPLHFFMWEDTGFTLYALVVLFVTACFSVGSMSLLASHSRSFFASESPWMYVHRLFNANVVIILTFCFRRQSYD